MLALITASLVTVSVYLDVLQPIWKVPEHVLDLFEKPPVLGGTVVNQFEPPPVLGRTGLDRIKPIVNRLAVHSILSWTD